MRVRLAIGDFSRMTHLSVVTLRHYHEVGLLTPAEIDPHSGYRFYEPGQVRIAQVIRRFRDLGMPLDQIREVLEASDTPARNQVIAAHLQRMEAQLALTQSVVASLRFPTPSWRWPCTPAPWPTWIRPTVRWASTWPSAKSGSAGRSVSSTWSRRSTPSTSRT
jgi:DNA-binding transcriptional MerR regulator